MRNAIGAIITFCALSLAALPASAADRKVVSESVDGEWISLTGTVKAVAGDLFTLNYGEGQITVEMDDYDSYNENLLLAGDHVTVVGRVDNDFYELKSIEARFVYVPKLSTYFYASALDDEGSYPVVYFNWNTAARDGEWIAITGTVKTIDGKDMTLDNGFRTVAVDTSDMTNSPVGFSVDVGDRVWVSGEMDGADLFEGREIEATSVVILKNNVI